MTDDLATCRGFQWDEGNAEKNWVQHHVSQGEAEQVFFNHPVVVVAGEQRAKLTLVLDASPRPIRTERPTTISTGAERCHFHFIRDPAKAGKGTRDVVLGWAATAPDAKATETEVL